MNENPSYVTELARVCSVCKEKNAVKIYDMVHWTCYACYVKEFERKTLEEIRRWGSE